MTDVTAQQLSKIKHFDQRQAQQLCNTAATLQQAG
jgi:hypothetical protein